MAAETAKERRERTARSVRTAERLGVARRRGRVPRQQPPTRIMIQMGKALALLVEAAMRAWQPLFEALPGMIARAHAARGDAAGTTRRASRIRSDEGEGRAALALIERCYRDMVALLNPDGVSAIAELYARQATRWNRQQLKKQMQAALGVDVDLRDRGVPTMVENFAAEVVAHVLALPEQIAADVGKLVTRALSTGRIDAKNAPTVVGGLVVERSDSVALKWSIGDAAARRDASRATIANVRLIRNRPRPFPAAQIAEEVEATGFADGLAAELAATLESRFGFAQRQSKFVARDQLGKLNGQVNAARQQELGVTRFTWRCQDDERVRGRPDGKYPDANPSHWDRNGEVYSYDDPPEDGLPGEPINCRCWADPLFDDILDDLDDEEDASAEDE